MKISLICALILCTVLQSYGQHKDQNLYYAQQAEKARKMRSTGILLTVLGGTSLIIAGASEAANFKTFSYTPGQPQNADNDKTSSIAAVVAVACVGTGVPLIIIGGKKRRMYHQKAKDASVTININQQKRGITLTYRL